MAEPRFDPARTLSVDLPRGRLTLDGSDARLLVSLSAVDELLESCSADARRAFGLRAGTEIGRRLVERLGEQLLVGAPVELIVEHLGGELALMGLGSLEVEQWGRALVFGIDQVIGSPRIAGLLADILEGVLQRSLSRDASLVSLGTEDGRLRLLVVGRQVKPVVDEWLQQGTSYGEVLTRLNRSHSDRGVS